MRSLDLSEKAKVLIRHSFQVDRSREWRLQEHLANNPKILLCDEATSALDPTTTKAILALLKEINEKYGITIVIITHEMAVVQEICTHVAIVDSGNLAETGTVEEVFSRPKSSAARKLVFQDENGKYEEMTGKQMHPYRI